MSIEKNVAGVAAKSYLDMYPTDIGIEIEISKKIKNDQKRILTPKQAYKNGSDWLVIGRPITKGDIKKNIQKLIDHLNQ